MALLQTKYDQSIQVANYSVSNLAVTGYCVQTSKGGWTAWKKDPSGVISVAPACDASICA